MKGWVKGWHYCDLESCSVNFDPKIVFIFLQLNEFLPSHYDCLKFN